MTSDSSAPKTTLLWYRDDLRIIDHEALTAARADGAVVALWIRETRDEDGLGPRPLGEASRWWAHESLVALSAALAEVGIPLLLATGPAAQIVPTTAQAIGAEAVRWSRRYAPRSRELDRLIKTELTDLGIEAHSHPGSLLVEPWEVAPSSASDYYQVFTPYWRAAREIPISPPLPAVTPQDLDADLRARIDAAVDGDDSTGTEVAALGLINSRPQWWESTIARHWDPGCTAAQDALGHLGERIDSYSLDRDLPGQSEGTSRMSPRLRFGEVSPRQLLAEVQAIADIGDEDRQAWVRQLYWREFSWHLTFHIPEIDWRPIRPEFASFPYADDSETLRAWQRGETGIALVDAGMRELWETGWMHNRVRMVTASLLTKNLLQSWQTGEQWFWNTLVDADEANNPVSWQWVAGCGADASPFFRIFNPERQRARFDPDDAYIRRWVPERLGAGDDEAQVAPIVDLGESRLEALDAYEAMKNTSPGS